MHHPRSSPPPQQHPIRAIRAFGSAIALSFASLAAQASDTHAAALSQDAVDQIIEPLLREQGIPGMVVATLRQGKAQFHTYGFADPLKQQAVSKDTLFELGSVSKLFTALAGAQAQALGKLSLSDPAGQWMPVLKGSALEHVTLLQLATYTAGGLPLQFPAQVADAEQMRGYFRQWQPLYAAGTHRQYSNPSIGLFGLLVAESMHQSFQDLLEQRLFTGLGMTHTYVQVPDSAQARYAFGQAKDGRFIRVHPGLLDAQAYGVKSSAADMLTFVRANMQPSALAPSLRAAMATTHQGRYRVGNTTQALGWERYPYPTDVPTLVEGNSSAMALEAHKVEPLSASASTANDPDVLFNKTGSTNGFGAYVAFVPSKQIGVIMLANKNYPNAARVRAAHAILSTLAP